MRRATAEPYLGIPWTAGSRLTDLDFADDIALLAETRSRLQRITTRLEKEAGRAGLKISGQKTKVMVTSGDQDQGDQLVIGQEVVEDVTSFTYLGSIVASDGDAEADVRCRIGKAATVFRRVTSIWSSKVITTRTKIRLYSTSVLPTAI